MDVPTFTLGRFLPVGNTDPEYVFRVLLARLEACWLEVGDPPLAARLEVVEAFANDLRRLGPTNLLYSDGDYLFAHSDRRRQPDGSLGPPGLHVLHRECVESRLCRKVCCDHCMQYLRPHCNLLKTVVQKIFATEPTRPPF